MQTFGRKVIYTDVDEITGDNVVEVLRKAMLTHAKNQREIQYLYDYYKGKHPVLTRVKEVRPEIQNNVVENRAFEIISFKVGYLMGEPVQYVSQSAETDNADEITTLNAYMTSENKASKDKELADWFHICGTSYRMVLPDSAVGEDDEAPFELYTLDPRYAFVVYQNALGEPPVMAVKFIKRQDDTVIYSCYTKDHYWEIIGDSPLLPDKMWINFGKSRKQYFGIPIVEYPANSARLGAFEPVLGLLDALDVTLSNRVDGVEQFIQALMLFHNVDITDEDFQKLREQGALKYNDLDSSTQAEIKYLTAELNQTQTQTLVDHMYNAILTICGMPNRNNGSDGGSTGVAVVYRDGWSAAETRAKDSELVFKRSEREMLKKVLRICRDTTGLNLKISDIKIQFTRRNYENIQERVNILVSMLDNENIAPQLAFEYCNIFPDPDRAFKLSEQWKRQQEANNLENLMAQVAVTARTGEVLEEEE